MELEVLLTELPMVLTAWCLFPECIVVEVEMFVDLGLQGTRRVGANLRSSEVQNSNHFVQMAISSSWWFCVHEEPSSGTDAELGVEVWPSF